MPATDFGWSMDGQPTLSKMFGTKRKNSADDHTEDSMCETVSKRRCTDLHDDGAPMENISDSNTMEMTMEQAQDLYSHNCLSKGNQQHIWNRPLTPVPHHAGDNNCMIDNNNVTYNYSTGHPQQQHEENNNQTSFTHQSFSENDMIMDLTDEVYNTAQVNLYPTDVTTDAEYEAACSMVAAMEGEGAPDPHQYRISHKEQVCGANDMQSLPKKLSWNGIVHMQPYFSDYY